MPTTYDAIIAGLGAMGSATAFHLAKRGVRVLGLDQFAPPHTFGSSHGESRIIREAYFEHPIYVPLVQRAYELWAELEREIDWRLFLQTGGLMIGPPDGVVVPGARLSAETHRLKHQILSSEEVQCRFPALQPAADMIAVSEPRAGVLFPEQCVAAHLQAAAKHGATVQLNEKALRWQPNSSGVRVFTDKSEYSAGQLVVSAGAWVKTLLPDLPIPLKVERQILFWFEPRDRAVVSAERCPIHLWEFEPRRFFYGFPDLGTGVKLAIHHEGEVTNADSVRREVAPDEVEKMRAVVRSYLPAVSEKLLRTAVCIYTNTPDEHFLLDRHPDHSQVLIVSPCSGHGFKFSSVIGEVVADLVTSANPRFDLDLFRLRRDFLSI